MTAFLYVKQELDDIAVLHYIFLTFGAVEAPGLDFAHFSAALHQGVEIAHLRANKAAFEVGVDFAGGLGCFGSLLMVQARHSFLPSVRKEIRPSRE